jgi:hypothetical protein
LRLLKSLERLGIASNILERTRRNLSHLRARLRYCGNRLLFKVRSSLHGVHKIRHKVGTPLVDVLDLSPFRLGILVERHETVVRSNKREAEDNDNQYDRRHDAKKNSVSHFPLLFFRFIVKLEKLNALSN